jgi:hypothetical protein
MTSPHAGAGASRAVTDQKSLGGLSSRSTTGKVISRKKNIHRGIPISTSPGHHTKGDHIAVSPSTGLSLRARLNISSIFTESHVH